MLEQSLAHWMRPINGGSQSSAWVRICWRLCLNAQGRAPFVRAQELGCGCKWSVPPGHRLGGSHPGRQDPASLRVGTSCPLGCFSLCRLLSAKSSPASCAVEGSCGLQPRLLQGALSWTWVFWAGVRALTCDSKSHLWSTCSNLIEGHKPWPHLTQGSL